MVGNHGLLRSNLSYRVYFLARISSVAGGSVAPIALAFVTLEFGDGATGISAVVAVEYIAYMTMVPLMGVLADKTGNGRALLICSQLLTDHAGAGSGGRVLAASVLDLGEGGVQLIEGVSDGRRDGGRSRQGCTTGRVVRTARAQGVAQTEMTPPAL
jgi:MFS family permease